MKRSKSVPECRGNCNKEDEIYTVVYISFLTENDTLLLWQKLLK